MNTRLETSTLNRATREKPGALDIKESNASILSAKVDSRLAEMTQERRAQIYQTVVHGAYGRGLKLEGGNIPMIPVPAFFDKETVQTAAGHVENVHNSLLKVEGLALSPTHPVGRELLKTITAEMPQNEKELLLKAAARRPETARRRNTRFDTFHDPKTGKTQIIEGNTTNPEGLWYHYVLSRASLDFMTQIGMYDPRFDQSEDSAAHQVFDMLKDEYASRNDGESPRTVAMVFDQGGEDSTINRSELPNLKEFFESRSDMEVVLADPTDFIAKDGKMYVDGREIDVAWRNTTNLQNAMKEAPGWTEIISNPDKYVVLNDETGRISGNKNVLGYLHDPDVQKAAKLSRSEIHSIREVVPFTFNPAKIKALGCGGSKLSPEDYLNKFRSDFVLKPMLGTHGNGVHFGINDDGWEEAVRVAIKSGDYIAQRYVPYETITTDVTLIGPDGSLTKGRYHRDTNFHVINGKATGSTICRATPVNGKVDILNVAAGGGIQPTITI